MALAADTTAQERAPTLVEYATAGAMTLVAIVAASPVYITRQFGVLVTALAVAGVPASILWRHIGIPRRLLNISVFSIATAMGVAVFAALAGGGASAATEGVRQIVASERLAMMVLIQVFVWIAAFRCWTLTTARDSPLSIVPAASILILAAVMIMRGVLVAVAFAAFFLLATLSVAFYTSAARATGRLAGAHVDPQMQAVLPAMLLGLGAVAIAVPVAMWLGSLAAPQRWRQEFRTVATVRLATLLVYWSTRPSIVPATNVSLGDTPHRGAHAFPHQSARTDAVANRRVCQVRWQHLVSGEYELIHGAETGRRLVVTACPGSGPEGWCVSQPHQPAVEPGFNRPRRAPGSLRTPPGAVV